MVLRIFRWGCER